MFKPILAVAVIISSSVGLVAQTDSPAVSRDSSWKLVWSDEFNGTTLDTTKWGFDMGNGFHPPDDPTAWIWGWGNDELEYYTDRPDNVYVKDGLLHIRAVKESYKGCEYTSARLVTRGLFSKAYGRFEFRAKLPSGQGMWPALWLLPSDNAYGVWAASGEIDILEARGQEPFQILGTIHYGSRWPMNDFTEADTVLPGKGTISDFHVYDLEWEPGVMRWYVDGQLYSVKRHWWSCSKTDAHHQPLQHPAAADLNPWPAPFDKPFYIVMNLAVGGKFPGNPSAETVFPQEMLVDYVRVYDKVGGYGPLPAPQSDLPEDLALNKPATASSQENDDETAAKANDGNGATRWCAANGDVPQWWQVDLQKAARLTGAEIKWERDGKNYRYVVEGSADGRTWQTLSDQSSSTSTSQVQELKFDARGVRYVRIRVTGLEKGTWASFYLVRLFGSD